MQFSLQRKVPRKCIQHTRVYNYLKEMKQNSIQCSIFFLRNSFCLTYINDLFMEFSIVPYYIIQAHLRCVYPSLDTF